MSSDDLALDSIEGIGPIIKTKLENAGIFTVLDVAVRGPSELAEAIGVDLKRALVFSTHARNRLSELDILAKDFIPASEIYEKRKNIERISTGTKNLDELLSGGIETQAVTEFYGEFGSGKTQLCHTLCVQVQLPKEKGGLDSGAAYIDTEGTFRPERIVDISKSRGEDPDLILEKITVAKAYNSAHQELIVSELGRIIAKEKIKLVIVDSAVAHFRAEYLGRGTLSERQQRLNRFMHLLVRTAETRNVAVVVTNQVQSSPDVFFGDPAKPVGGHVVAHTSTYRIYLKKAGKNRIARMIDSPYHPERETPFVLNIKGVDDPSEEVTRRKKS